MSQGRWEWGIRRMCKRIYKIGRKKEQGGTFFMVERSPIINYWNLIYLKFTCVSSHSIRESTGKLGKVFTKREG